MWELLCRRDKDVCRLRDTRTQRVRKFLSAGGLWSGAEDLLSLAKFNFTKNFNQTSVNSVTQQWLLANSCHREEKKKSKHLGIFRRNRSLIHFTLMQFEGSIWNVWILINSHLLKLKQYIALQLKVILFFMGVSLSFKMCINIIFS